jgi:hypothetical protein
MRSGHPGPETKSRGRRALLAWLVLLALTGGACRGAGQAESGDEAAGSADPATYSATVDHPLVPLSLIPYTVFEGSELDPETGEAIEIRAEKRVLDETEVVAGVHVAILEVKEYEDGELVESTLDYFAQRQDGSVWYFGEAVSDYEDGKLVGHEGQWLAGEGGAKPGLFMPAKPKVGQVFEQERAPGVAEDRSTVVALGVDVTTPAGMFSDCIKTRDFAPLDNLTEFKYYCPGAGLVREDFPAGGKIELVRHS